MFGGLVTLKDSPIYECNKCREKFAAGKIVGKTLEEARKQFSFARKIVSTGGSLAITMPPDLARFCKLKKGGNIQLVECPSNNFKYNFFLLLACQNRLLP